ncbi:hypothetical protein JCM5805K_2945 [Lactococcus lactis subsp. lactis]|uniref:Uncharacterized protein n=1 Tax=Lactococcus lactis subsp. lactis TaxID=1360 RepID=A0A0B8R3K7_LACLL|nr:hypothetical protein JCM5805K_2945 [Lactococcus lactis subsp. lactis]
MPVHSDKKTSFESFVILTVGSGSAMNTEFLFAPVIT